MVSAQELAIRARLSTCAAVALTGTSLWANQTLRKLRPRGWATEPGIGGFWRKHARAGEPFVLLKPPATSVAALASGTCLALRGSHFDRGRCRLCVG